MEEEERQGSRSSQDKDTLEDKDKDKEDKDALEVEVVEEKEGKQTRAEDLKLNQVNPGPGNPMLDSKEPPKEFESIPRVRKEVPSVLYKCFRVKIGFE